MELAERTAWSEQHKALNAIILKPQKHIQAIEMFLDLHAWMYTSEVGNTDKLTLEDEVVANLEEKTFRTYPVTNPNTKNSIAWHLWHLARIEDMTMNMLIAGGQQVLYAGDFYERMNTRFTHSGNEMSEEDMAELSSSLHFDSLIAYRTAVGKRTRQIIASLEPGQLKEKIDPTRIQRLFDEAAVTQKATWLAEYWSRKSIGGLLLMPPTRHNFMHLNKCLQIKDKLQK